MDEAAGREGTANGRDAGGTVPLRPRPAASLRRLPSRLGLAALLVVAVVCSVITVTAAVSDREPAVIRRDDAATDLLGWLPADDETRRAFAVWAGESESATADAARGPVLGEQLGLEPMPRTLGRSPGWAARFGYSVQDVTGWAIGGATNGVAVLAGTFDEGATAAALKAAGYRETTYRGARLFVLDDEATADPAGGEDAPARSPRSCSSTTGWSPPRTRRGHKPPSTRPPAAGLRLRKTPRSLRCFGRSVRPRV